jgi:hypothetical protein
MAGFTDITGMHHCPSHTQTFLRAEQKYCCKTPFGGAQQHVMGTEVILKMV